MEPGREAERFFTDRELKHLIVPLVIEQFLAITVGMADTVMISYAGERAVSGVALVDLINVLLLNVFAAVSTGGAVVASQYLGKGDREKCCKSASQLVLASGLISLAIMAAVLAFKEKALALLYPSVEGEVMENAVVYLRIFAFSYPFLAVFNACAALFRSMGNSKLSMKVSAGMNLMNIAGNAVLIFGFGMGAAGAAWASAASRAAACAVLFLLVLDRRRPIFVQPRQIFSWDREMIGKILCIGIPNGVENGLFQLGRVMVVSIISGFGTVQIAANAVANNLDNMGCISGQAMSLAMVTVVGRCIGAGDYGQAEAYVKRMMKISYILGAVSNGLVLLTLPLSLRLYSLTPETAELAALLILIHCGLGIFLWPAAFTFPSALRAAGDVKATMAISVFSMLAFRVFLSVILGVYLGLGAVGVWMAMIVDWLFRLSMFIRRYRQGRWKKIRLV